MEGFNMGGLENALNSINNILKQALNQKEKLERSKVPICMVSDDTKDAFKKCDEMAKEIKRMMTRLSALKEKIWAEFQLEVDTSQYEALEYDEGSGMVIGTPNGWEKSHE